MKTALYYIRTRCNYSQGMVARELDVSRQMLSAWENGTKTIPKARKEELAMLFGVPVEILEEQDGSTIRSYCDRPMFCCVCQGRQVFSFRPKSDHSRVWLETPREDRPESRCRELMDRKNAVLELINQTMRFDPEHQAEQLPVMELSVSLLEEFGKLLACCGSMEPEHRGRFLRFVLEQEEILTAVLGEDTKEHRDEWQKQQIHLLRCRWWKTNRTADRRRIGVEKVDPRSVWEQINQWYQRAKTAGWDRAEILYDSVAGGAGHVRRIVTDDGDAFQRVLERAINIVDSCDCDCSCYKCLRNYYNQKIHDNLSRQQASAFLHQWQGKMTLIFVSLS